MATRNIKNGKSETRYVEMSLGNERPVIIQVDDRAMKNDRQRTMELGKMKQLREPFRSDLVRGIIRGRAETMTGDTAINLSRINYYRDNAPMKISHAVMAYTRLRSAAEDVANNLNAQKQRLLTTSGMRIVL